MRLELVNALQLTIIAFISYVITISFAGWFEALVAEKMGDDAPQSAGFLTLNPLEHFNVFGFAALLWGIFVGEHSSLQLIPGWGRYIPLIPDNISGKWYKLRIGIEYIGRSIAHLIILLCTATSMMIILGVLHIDTHGIILKFTTQITSFTEVIISLLAFLFRQNLILFVIHFILGIFKYIIYFYMPRVQEVSFLTILFAFLALTVGLYIFGPMLEILAFQIIAIIQSLLFYITK